MCRVNVLIFVHFVIVINMVVNTFTIVTRNKLYLYVI